MLFAWLLAPLALLLVAVAVELAVTPSDLWMTRIIGSNWYHCLSVIPLLSIAPLGALIVALARGRAALSRADGRARRRSRGRRGGDDVCEQLHRRFAAVRRHLVPARDADRDGGRRAGGTSVAEVVIVPSGGL